MYNKVDSTISDDFRSGARNATIFSLLIIFLYIFFGSGSGSTDWVHSSP